MCCGLSDFGMAVWPMFSELWWRGKAVSTQRTHSCVTRWPCVPHACKDTELRGAGVSGRLRYDAVGVRGKVQRIVVETAFVGAHAL